MTMHSCPLALVGLIILIGSITLPLAGQESKSTFKDPAPPKLEKLDAIEAPAAKAFEGLKTHLEPRPLPKDAKVEDWPSFLGPRRDSRCRETGLDLDFGSEGPPLLWEMTRGEGFSAPVIADGRVVYAHRIASDCVIDCLDAESGKRFWRFAYPTDYSGRYIRDKGPRATPTIDEGRVYMHGAEGMLHCLELSSGRVLWKRNTKKEFDAPDNYFGIVTSPLLVGDRLYINIGGNKGPCVAAFDKVTGRMIWGVGSTWKASCSSPVLGRVGEDERLFVWAAGQSRPATGGLMVIDPKDGRLIHEHPYRSRTVESVVASTPLIGPDWLFLSSSYNLGSTALSFDAKKPYEVLWKSRRIGLEFSNPLLHQGSVFVVDGASDRAGALVELAPESGEELTRLDLNWDETVLRNGEERKLPFSVGQGSLLAVGEKLLLLGDNGHLLTLEKGKDGWIERCRSWLFKANQSWTPLALSHGLLYVCQNKRERFGDEPARLLCFDLRKSK